MFRLLLAGLLVLGSWSIQAQKFGHVHSMNLLAQLPEIATADSLLQVFQADLQIQGDSMVDQFRIRYEAYVRDAQSGTLSKLQAQNRETQLTQEQERIQQFEKEAQLLIVQQRQALYEPILNRVDEAIEALGREEGYSMIFDASQQALLFLTASEDLSDKVLARLRL